MVAPIPFVPRSALPAVASSALPVPSALRVPKAPKESRAKQALKVRKGYKALRESPAPWVCKAR